MNRKIITIFLAVILPYTSTAQLLCPLGNGFNGGERLGENSNTGTHAMHVEGDKLYVCTSQGLYAKDLADDNSAWQLAGFNGIPLQDYVRRGSDILALRYNKGGGFLLLSHDDGQTYEDVTPDILCHEKSAYLLSLVQHPTEPNCLLTSSYYHGILRSTDFGQTWERLTDGVYGRHMGFHPARPSIIYNSGEGMIFDGHLILSYDDGKTWTHYSTWTFGDRWLGFSGDNHVYRLTFHPINPDRWIAGGAACVFLSDDNGCTWSCLDFHNDKSRTASWLFTVFDEEHPDTVYMAGYLSPNGRMGMNSRISLMCSTNGGRSWYESQVTESKMEDEKLYDLLQYRDRLIVYTESGVYTVSKAELIAQSVSAIRSVTSDIVNAQLFFDLQGRRLSGKPAKGVYIQNGRKVLK